MKVVKIRMVIEESNQSEEVIKVTSAFIDSRSVLVTSEQTLRRILTLESGIQITKLLVVLARS